MLAPGPLCGELYNALAARGVIAYKANYADAGWRLSIRRAGGNFRGVPILECRYADMPPRVTIRVRTLFRSRQIAEWPLEDTQSVDELADRYCRLFGLRTAPV